MQPYEMAATFHQIFDDRQPKIPTPFTLQEAIFRQGFKLEELIELLHVTAGDDQQAFDQACLAMHQVIEQTKEKILKKAATQKVSVQTASKEVNATDDLTILTQQVDALVDLLYFTYGSFVLLGVDPKPMLEIVHQANLGKLFPDGKPHHDPVTNKVLKPADWAQRYAPEPKILAELKRQIALAQEKQQSDLLQ
ncbi:hypothetical protein [Enterococcus columbae]|uniref:Cof family protein n=1 Tax=Enterococcus columbae DSM 7374 = ATCC 51263 TaxID=1121865 RepID=S1N559_9ENTE|nr:hypothetical protein [Enterococcus columbae]EOT44824.1 hypothetical protein OMW_00009 [Enterococcus columbae DSM 7374 = ATCC 51263]EOW84117.1 hypothetical protein I568_00603 [Enterococcus columbae DSM 7374 = ATCC 51263]